MNDAEGLQKSRAGYFKLGWTGGSLSRCRGVNRRFRGSRPGRWSSSTSMGRAAGVPPLLEVGEGPLADSPRPLHRWSAGCEGGAGVHTRCGDSSPHRLGVGSGGDGAGAVRGPPAFKFGQEG